MSIVSTSASLTDLKVGDKIVIKRCRDRPAHTKQAFCDPGNGSTTKLVHDPEVVEKVGMCTVVDRREVPAVAGWGGREAKSLVRLPNGFWYDCATGLQDGSNATRIERA